MLSGGREIFVLGDVVPNLGESTLNAGSHPRQHVGNLPRNSLIATTNSAFRSSRGQFTSVRPSQDMRTRMAGLSRWATPLAPRAPSSPRRHSMNCTELPAAMH
jgi:hypothetical protein